MITTPVFSKTIKAYNDGFRFIANKGSSRSSKTFSELQLIKSICELDKNSINTVVSHSFPHLEGGAIRDWENILNTDGYNVSGMKHEKPRFYKLNSNIIEFIGFDNPGKALGASRKRLFINEANKMPHSVVHQLTQRTEEVIFLDWNPSNDFWFDDEGYEQRDNCHVIHSTFLENYNPLTGRSNLTEGQLEEFYQAKCKAEEEDKRGQRGYWWNWWQVYGLGLKGQLEGAILQNWTFGPFNDSLPFAYGLDFGSIHPDAMVKVAVDRPTKRLFWKEEIYQNKLSTEKLYELIVSRGVGKHLIVADSAATRTIDDLAGKGLNIKPVHKNKIVDDVKMLNDWMIIVDPDSHNLAKSLRNWVWLDKKGEIPIDIWDDLIDAGRYISQTLIQPATTFHGHKSLTITRR